MHTEEGSTVPGNPLELLAPNSFIPFDFTLIAAAPDAAAAVSPTHVRPPDLLISDSRSQLWHRIDTAKFEQPRVTLDALIKSPHLIGANSSVCSIMVAAIENTLAVHTYAAHIAGLKFSVGAHRLGIHLSIVGCVVAP